MADGNLIEIRNQPLVIRGSWYLVYDSRPVIAFRQLAQLLPPRDYDRPFRPAPRGRAAPLEFDNRAITSRLDPLGTYAGCEELDGRLRPTSRESWQRRWDRTDHDRGDEDYDR